MRDLADSFLLASNPSLSPASNEIISATNKTKPRFRCRHRPERSRVDLRARADMECVQLRHGRQLCSVHSNTWITACSSWGKCWKSWGANGFIRFPRGVKSCSVVSEAVQPKWHNRSAEKRTSEHVAWEFDCSLNCEWSRTRHQGVRGSFFRAL